MRHPLVTRVALVASLVLAAANCAHALAAPARVKVVASTATIHLDPATSSRAVAIVGAGTVLDVIATAPGWFKVSVPAGLNRAERPGYIEEKAVVPTTERPILVPVGQRPPVAGKPGARPAREPMRARVFGDIAFQSFLAKDSLEAVLDSSNGLLYGGGVEVRFSRHLFVQAGATHFRKDGERAYVYQGEIFKLGIDDRVRLTPITVNVGYRVPGKRFSTYVAGGSGAAIYSEKADYAGSGDDVSKTGVTIQALGGIEFPLAKSLAVAVEGQYQSIRGILGDAGISQALGEKDLGGISVHVKVLFGK